MNTSHFNKARFRDEFPHLSEGFTHLNHAGFSPGSDRIVVRMNALTTGFSRDPVGTLMPAIADMISCRTRLARLMGVPPEHLAFTKNTAHGISIVADGLDWQDGDNVVFADCEYPANTYPWLAQRDRGVTVNVVPTQHDGTILLDDYAAAITPKTRIVAVSWVQFTTGFRVDLHDLIALAHERGAMVLVDVIQGLGAMPINLTELDADFAAVGSQKWLLGPLGVGGLYAKPEALAHLRLVNMGAGSVVNYATYDALGFDPKPTVQRYEEGTPNLPGMIGLDAALSMLEDAGADVIETEIRALTRRAMEGVRERGYLLKSPEDDAKRAGIVAFRHPSISNETVLQALTDAKINAAVRGGNVRFAPHFYNTNEDIDRALNALPK